MKFLSRLFSAPPPASADARAREHPAAEAGTTAIVPAPPAAAPPVEVDLDSIQDPARLAEFVVAGSTSGLRQRAAERIADPDQLRELLRRVRGSDKAVYKILKQKCAALNAADRRRAQHAADVRAVCESLERHAGRSLDATYAASLEHLIGKWQALSPAPDPASEARCRTAVARCRERLAELAREVAERESRRVAAEAAAAQLARERQEAQAQAETAARAEADAQEAMRAAQAAADAARRDEEAVQERRVRQLGALLRRAHDSLRDGHTQQAAGLRRAIAEKWPADWTSPPHLARQLQQLDDRLAELKGWKDYAVAPKRLELIAEMESLIGAEGEPRALARRIQTLQAQWRTISKGIASGAPADWERFHQASQAAYRPCADYFERQAAQRRDNLQSRRGLLERLAGFEAVHTGEQTDWRLLTQVLREAPLEWRGYFPVEREANRPLQAAFDAALARLQRTLDAWHARNAADKRALIQRARHLAAQEDTRAAIESVKPLQILWKETGQAARANDRELWGEFREVCDGIYRRRDQENAAYTAGLETAKRDGERLCEEVERQAAHAGTELAAAAGRIPEWRAAFEGLGEMPRADSRAVHERFERALLRLESEVANAGRRAAEHAVERLFEALRHVRAYEWSVVQSAGEEERERLKRIAEESIAGVPLWPKGARILVNEALERAPAGTGLDPGDAEKALRLLCIRAEIRGDVRTPEEDAPLRRDYQVQRLMTGMGGGGGAGFGAGRDGGLDVESAAQEWDALLLAWIPVGGVSPAVHEALQARFVTSLGPRPVARPPRTTFQPRPEAAVHRDRADRGRPRSSARR